MKKIISFIVLLAGVISFTSCDNDSTNPYAHESVIQIVKADELTFNSIGGESYIEFTAPANVQITANADWVTLTQQSATRVDVAVTANNDKSDRSAQVTFKSGADEVIVTVHQLGFVLRIDVPESVTYGNAASSHSFPMNTSGEVTVESDVDWITAYIDGDNLCYDIAANDQHIWRTGTVTYRSGAYENSIVIRQGEAKDMVGRNFLIYGVNLLRAVDPEDPFSMMMVASVTSTSQVELWFPEDGISGLSTKIKINESDFSVNIVGGGLGKLTKTIYGYLGTYDLTIGAALWNGNITFKFPLKYYDVEGFSGYYGELVAQPVMLEGDEYSADAMAIYKFADSAYEGNPTGFFAVYGNCSMEEYTGDLDDLENEEARSIAIKKAKSNAIARRTLGRR